MAITGKHPADIARLKQDLKAICEHHINFFGDIPFKNYLFLTLATARGYGGLEHQNSSSLICSRKDLPTLDNPQITPEYTRFLALCSHEYFHAWWIKTLKPANFFNLDLDRENYTEQLWIFEGFTAYYDELSLLRVKILSPEQYLTLFAQTITKLQKSRGRDKQSLSESSFEAWTKFYQQDENAPNAIVSYYTKGALLAFVLDVEIRKRSEDAKSLDDILRFAWDNYQAVGLENHTLQNIVNELVGQDFSQFFDDYLYGLKPLPLKSAFDYVGVELTFIHPENDLSAFGLELKLDGENSLITCIFEGSCAQLSGLYVGDKILSVGGKNVKFKDLPTIIGAYQVAEVLEIGILRDELPLNLRVKINLLKPTFCKLSLKNNPNSSTQKRRLNWFYQA
jgi:predicted metalloprotease with PDZ domain